MVSKLQEFQAQFFQIAGFACMTPIGKIFLNILDLELKDLSIKFFIYSLVSVFLFCIGIILNIKGMEYLEEREVKWIQ